MYKKVPTDMNFVGREKEVEKFWDENHIFEKSIEEREGCPEYIFYDGPPTANGKPHIGTLSGSPTFLPVSVKPRIFAACSAFSPIIS